MAWAIELELESLTPTNKLVLLTLANHHNKITQRCYPTHETVARETRLSQRSVVRAVEQLEAMGLIQVVPRHDEAGRRLANEYYLHVPPCHPGVTEPSDTVSPPSTSYEPKDNPEHLANANSNSGSVLGRRLQLSVAHPEFFEFWQAYPRKLNKHLAAKAWAAANLGRDDVARLCSDIAKRYAGVDRQFVPYAATYLSQRRWEDEDMPNGKGGRGQRQSGKLPIMAYEDTVEEKKDE